MADIINNNENSSTENDNTDDGIASITVTNPFLSWRLACQEIVRLTKARAENLVLIGRAVRRAKELWLAMPGNSDLNFAKALEAEIELDSVSTNRVIQISKIADEVVRQAPLFVLADQDTSLRLVRAPSVEVQLQAVAAAKTVEATPLPGETRSQTQKRGKKAVKEVLAANPSEKQKRAAAKKAAKSKPTTPADSGVQLITPVAPAAERDVTEPPNRLGIPPRDGLSVQLRAGVRQEVESLGVTLWSPVDITVVVSKIRKVPNRNDAKLSEKTWYLACDSACEMLKMPGLRVAFDDHNEGATFRIDDVDVVKIRFYRSLRYSKCKNAQGYGDVPGVVIRDCGWEFRRGRGDKHNETIGFLATEIAAAIKAVDPTRYRRELAELEGPPEPSKAIENRDLEAMLRKSGIEIGPEAPNLAS